MLMYNLTVHILQKNELKLEDIDIIILCPTSEGKMVILK